MPGSASWQDLKDHMREAGEVCYAEVLRDRSRRDDRPDLMRCKGIVEYVRYEDLKFALKTLDDTRFKSREGETAYIRVREEGGSYRPERYAHHDGVREEDASPERNNKYDRSPDRSVSSSVRMSSRSQTNRDRSRSPRSGSGSSHATKASHSASRRASEASSQAPSHHHHQWSTSSAKPSRTKTRTRTRSGS